MAISDYFQKTTNSGFKIQKWLDYEVAKVATENVSLSLAKTKMAKKNLMEVV